MASQTILLVEDNPDDVELTMLAFRRSRMANEILVAWNGEEALDYLLGRGAHSGRDPKDTPALVLLDLKLPGMGGLDVLRRIRENPDTKRVPVVILTTSDDEADIVTGYNLGVNSYIRKPVDFSSFVGVVDQMGLYWLVVNTPPPV
ncbi:MAG TPA: response regulator [Candidatus Omnitrophota bacterium]|nr:response regulator [Candidatus Omnitrophota bacterium]